MTDHTPGRDSFFDPDEGPPPRKVEPWTSVTGHQIIGKGQPGTFCRCGSWRAAKSESSADEHLRTAWPVLVEKLDGEAFEAYVGRVEQALADAERRNDQLDIEAGAHQSTPPGQALPMITTEMVAAGSRVDVLHHQLEELRARHPGWWDR